MRTPSRRRTAAAAVLAVTALAAAGCGSDDGSDSTSTPAASTPAPTDTTAAATGTDANATPTGTGGGLKVTSSEFAFDPTTLDAAAGKVEITLDNAGKIPHELVLLKTDTAADKLPVSGGRVSEKDSVGEISETDGGKTAAHEFDLKPGTYVFVCNIPGHYQDGMRGTLTVK